MDTYRAENDDEIELFPGDRVVILNKSMDGWWKIKYVTAPTCDHISPIATITIID